MSIASDKVSAAALEVRTIPADPTTARGTGCETVALTEAPTEVPGGSGLSQPWVLGVSGSGTLTVCGEGRP